MPRGAGEGGGGDPSLGLRSAGQEGGRLGRPPPPPAVVSSSVAPSRASPRVSRAPPWLRMLLCSGSSPPGPIWATDGPGGLPRRAAVVRPPLAGAVLRSVLPWRSCGGGAHPGPPGPDGLGGAAPLSPPAAREALLLPLGLWLCVAALSSAFCAPVARPSIPAPGAPSALMALGLGGCRGRNLFSWPSSCSGAPLGRSGAVASQMAVMAVTCSLRGPLSWLSVEPPLSCH